METLVVSRNKTESFDCHVWVFVHFGLISGIWRGIQAGRADTESRGGYGPLRHQERNWGRPGAQVRQRFCGKFVVP